MHFSNPELEMQLSLMKPLVRQSHTLQKPYSKGEPPFTLFNVALTQKMNVSKMNISF